MCWTCQGVGDFWVCMDILRACQSEGEWTIEACLTCQSVGGFGVRMDMSMGVLGHSELVGARDGYRSMKLFGQNKHRTIHFV